MYIIGDDDTIAPIDGMRGCVPRDFGIQPLKMMAVQFATYDRSTWPDRIRELVATQSQLSDIRNGGNYGQPIPSLDQNGQGYCWAYSTTAGCQLLRAKANQPYVPLSAHSVACKIKGFRDEGAWGALSQEFIVKNGIVPQSHWPAKSMSRSHDNPDNWAEAKKYRIGEEWADMAAEAWDRNLSADQVATMLLSRNPVVCDYNWWGHSVCGMDLVDLYPTRPATSLSRYGIRILNSWTDQWGENGTGVLADSKAWPDNATAILTTVAS